MCKIKKVGTHIRSGQNWLSDEGLRTWSDKNQIKTKYSTGVLIKFLHFSSLVSSRVRKCMFLFLCLNCDTCHVLKHAQLLSHDYTNLTVSIHF